MPKLEHYVAIGAAEELHRCRAREVLLEGPAGTGKTRALCEKGHIFAETYKNCRILFIRKTRASMTESVLPIFERDVLPENHPSIRNPINRTNRHSYKYPNGAEIITGGMDNPDRIMSTEYDLICAFEATELVLDDWEKAITRLRNRRGPYHQAVADCNPGGPQHWLNARASEGKMHRILSRHEHNPILYDPWGKEYTTLGGEYIDTLDGLTGARLRRLRYGEWCAEEGAVFEDDWNAAHHLIDSIPVDSYGEPIIKWCVAGVDWGFRDPGVIGVWGVDGDRRIYEQCEIYMSVKTIDWWLEQANYLMTDYDIRLFLADPSEPGYIQQFRDEGLPIKEANNDIMLGLRRMQERMKIGRDDRTRIHYVKNNVGWYDRGNWIPGTDRVMRDRNHPLCSPDEMYVYAYPKDDQNKPVKEKPVDMFNHGIDQTRYVVNWVDKNDMTPAEPVKKYEYGTMGHVAGHGASRSNGNGYDKDPFRRSGSVR